MPSPASDLEDRFLGCLLGLAIGDALGGHFEGQSAEFIASRCGSIAELIDAPPSGAMWYTDDTQMAIGVAETLVQCGRIEDDVLCKRFAENYEPHRGYGRGARAILEALVEGRDYKHAAATYFPGGSFGNGAAMRVAPVGLFHRSSPDAVWNDARLSALPTHVHPLGIEGAQVIALAVAIAACSDEFERVPFFEQLASRCSFLEYRGPLRRAVEVQDAADLGLFGNGIAATDSVVTAVASFGLTPDSFGETIGNAILLGGDTDTIAAMAGAISGAFLGASAIPTHLLDQLEDFGKGRQFIEQLASDLHRVHVNASRQP